MKVNRGRSRSWWLVAVVGIATAMVGHADDTPPGYAGSAVCMRCHDAFARRWAKVEHSQELLADGRRPAETGCEACHGPGADHALGQRPKIVAWDKLELDARTAVCLNCHQGKVEAEVWGTTAHSLVLSCDRCHDVHRPVEQDWLLRQPQVDLCGRCHDTLPAKVKAKEHHPLADGALTCDMCHNPHGTGHAHLLSQPQGELCEGCHGDDVPKGPEHDRKDWRLNHQAQAKGHEAQCLMCHDQETFCNQCHVVKVPHGENFAMAHNESAKQHSKACLNCHQKDFCLLCHDPLPTPGSTKE